MFICMFPHMIMNDDKKGNGKVFHRIQGRKSEANSTYKNLQYRAKIFRKVSFLRNRKTTYEHE